MSKIKPSVNELIKLCHSVAKSKGWWETERNDGELIALMHSELSEALEAMRNQPAGEKLVRITRAAAIFAALACLLGGYLIGRAWR